MRRRARKAAGFSSSKTITSRVCANFKRRLLLYLGSEEAPYKQTTNLTENLARRVSRRLRPNSNPYNLSGYPEIIITESSPPSSTAFMFETDGGREELSGQTMLGGEVDHRTIRPLRHSNELKKDCCMLESATTLSYRDNARLVRKRNQLGNRDNAPARSPW